MSQDERKYELLAPTTDRKTERKKEGVKEEVTYRDTSYLKMAFLMANFDVGADAYLENQLVKIII